MNQSRQTRLGEKATVRRKSTECKSIANKTCSVYADIDQTTARFENWISTFMDSIDVDLMPGPQDFSNAYLP
jgi:hypothetical protein